MRASHEVQSRTMKRVWLVFSAASLVASLTACPGNPPPRPIDKTVKPTKKAGARTISIVGTNDLHGALDRLPLFGGFIANIRAAREADGGGTLLLDAGDMFQGTLESNMAEGADIVKAYNALKYDAVCVGNHEFDFGPDGPLAVPKSIRVAHSSCARARRSSRSSSRTSRTSRAVTASSGRTCRHRSSSRSAAR